MYSEVAQEATAGSGGILKAKWTSNHYAGLELVTASPTRPLNSPTVAKKRTFGVLSVRAVDKSRVADHSRLGTKLGVAVP